ncbi:calcium-independent phospholipase A2-gamma [Megalops cyprinoides]|uniref:calcium-independent phospholipase A2-gamma n=1 Tax=Megalops cyprinoides TaxID=118141 RepID=UPI001863EB57|nr:calcium-independent phospholipase A2-gamma [Megalops cyprinoides]XP_036374230.1 calcium-independent phospholipase A2-gamma [Megalops cyprinoides]
MSRIRTTLDSVSKVISGKHTDVLSRIARLKPSAAPVGRGSEASLEDRHESPRSEAALPAAMTVPEQEERTGPAETAVQASGKQLTPPTKPEAGSVAAKHPTELYHPSYFSTGLGETYNYLSHHINAYFGSALKVEEKVVERKEDNSKASTTEQEGSPPSRGDHIPVLMPVSDKVSAESAPAPAPSSAGRPSTGPASDGPIPDSPNPNALPPNVPAPTVPTSPKKRIGHYLSYPSPSVQAFVGSYITPLVPKFRSDPKSIAAEKEKTPAVEEALSKPGEVAESKAQKAAEDQAKQRLQQREKIIASVTVDNRTRALVQALRRTSDVKICINRVEDLSYHLLEFPETSGVAVKERVIPCLLRLRQTGDLALQAAVREALALVGYTDPVKGRGIRVLSIDGGGTRGLVALQALHKLEALTGKPIYQLFDYICGVSTGAILAFMLGVFQIPLNECEEMYRRLGSDVFKRNVIVGTVKMGWSHAFYDSEAWETILKERMGADVMIETSRNPKCPKVAAVSTIVNRGTPLKAYVFRNYNLPPGVRSHYLGGCQHKLWQAIRASSAAPGYFQEFVLGNDLHQDGGLLINNPTALAIHECRCLWPNTPLQCVVSLGTGRFESPGNSATYTSLKAKLSNVISSATDTEEVHTMLDGLLPPDTYFRFNPYMNEDIPLDESRREKLNLLQTEGMRYLERNEDKLKKAAGVLLQEKSSMQRLAEWLRLKADMYDGLPFSSKL